MLLPFEGRQYCGQGRCFYSKAICKKAYERDIIVTVKLQYTDSRRKEVEKLLPNIFKYISINK